MRTIAFDIETGPDRSKIDTLPTPKAPGNYRDPDKIADFIRNAQDEQIGKMALDPTFGQIVCATFVCADPGNKGSFLQHTLFRTQGLKADDPRDDSDSTLVHAIFDNMMMADQLVTFNGVGFDFPFIVRRAMINHRPVPSIMLDFLRQPFAAIHPSSFHNDTMMTLHALEVGGLRSSSPVKASRSLHYYAEHLLGITPLEDPEHEDKTLIAKLFDAGELDKIEQVCTWDATATLQLHQLLKTYFPSEGGTTDAR